MLHLKNLKVGDVIILLFGGVTSYSIILNMNNRNKILILDINNNSLKIYSLSLLTKFTLI
jgi:hypothetical protein